MKKILIEKIKVAPTNPRQEIGDLTEIIQSITSRIKEKRRSIIEPIIVKKTKKGYEVVIGRRRFEAAKKIGLKSIPCLIDKFERREAIIAGLNENIHSKDLLWWEEGEAFEKLLGKRVDFRNKKGRFTRTEYIKGLSTTQIGNKIGKSGDYVQMRIKCSKALRNLKKEGLDISHLPFKIARDIAYSSDKDQIKLAKQILDHSLKEREVTKLKTKVRTIRSMLEKISDENIKEKLSKQIEPILFEKEMTLKLAEDLKLKALGLFVKTPFIVQVLAKLLPRINKFVKEFPGNSEYKEWEDKEKTYFQFKGWIEKEKLKINDSIKL